VLRCVWAKSNYSFLFPFNNVSAKAHLLLGGVKETNDSPAILCVPGKVVFGKPTVKAETLFRVENSVLLFYLLQVRMCLASSLLRHFHC
jgi:hypothetical protein